MTTTIEQRAKAYLLNQFSHRIYSFADKETGDKGFDLWLVENGGDRKKVELKATEGEFTRPSSLFERLVFNAEIEKTLFESGESVIARVFLGCSPYKVFVITNAIFGDGAELKTEARYVVRGKINYKKSYSELV
jgi:hypothetical protein